jgi:hypothetical protein
MSSVKKGVLIKLLLNWTIDCHEYPFKIISFIAAMNFDVKFPFYNYRKIKNRSIYTKEDSTGPPSRW